VAGLGACLLLPERFAVNVPVRNALFGMSAAPPAPEVLGSRIRVPPGFSIELYAEVPRVRWLRATSSGDLLASVPRDGKVVLIERDGDGDGRSDGVRTVLEGLNRPHGIDVAGGYLYVGETDAVARVGFDPLTGRTSGPLERIVTGLPAGGNHWTRTVRIGPDGALYVAVGSSCNVCVEDDPRRAALLRFAADGSGGEVFASGLRNAVGFDWQPDTGVLYATDNGRDLLGDDFPPCELNRVVEGGFYGWPFANGDRVSDPDLGAGREQEISTSISPAHDFRAHTAPLGIVFLQRPLAPGFPRGTAIAALHGSWNRTRKDGYEVVSLHWNGDGMVEERRFVWGFLENDAVIGRPVDVAVGADGAVYVSDDYAGAVYRVAPGTARAALPGGGPGPRAALAAVAEDRAGDAASAPARGADPLAALPAPERTAARERGAALYAAHQCARCHEAEGAERGMVAKPLGELRGRYDLRALAEFFLAPTPPMPALPLSEPERRDLAVFLLETRG
ncbi:MAG TPA: PQQ-dependent sugar dehydrogenase, partial [Myxococcota bacterium]|nr:PQQ-dependent sugar dehydrogenase [Myxococcota bacterium]